MDDKVFQYNAKCIGKYDVVVAGGGPAGFGAGIAAARGGLKTLLVEVSGCIGGVSTSGALPLMLGATNGSVPFPEMLKKGLKYSELPHPRKAVGGIYDLFVDVVKSEKGSHGIAVIPQTDEYPGLDRLGCHDDFIFDMEIGKRVFDQMASQYGLDVLYYSRALCPDMEENRVKGLWIANKDFVIYVECEAIIDCTGDADIAFQAGYETYKGDRETGAMTAVNLVTHIENINPEPIEKYLNEGGDPWFVPACTAARKENPDYDGPYNLIMFPMMQPGVFMVNSGSGKGNVDGTSSEALTEVTVWGRQRAKYLVEEIFRKHIPGAENCRLRQTATQPGVRETRRIVGEYILTEEDLVNGTIFEDTIALGGRHFDLHRGKAVQKDDIKAGDVYAQQENSFAGKNKVRLGVTQIPYRALIPKGSDDIIVAGRCIAADGQALGPARIMSTCMAVGEAAGTASIIKINNKVSYRNVDCNELRNILRENGAEVDL